MTAVRALPPSLLILAAAFLLATGAGAVPLYGGEHPTVIAVMLAQGAVYAAAVWLMLARRDDARWTGRGVLVVVLAVAGLARLMILPAPPVSTDVYRYVWDGRVQAAGINPYLHIPADPALSALRDPAIYPNINRADYAPTIYPPAAQMVFAAATRISESVTAMKAAMVAFEAALVWGLVVLLRNRGLPPARALLYGWHPLPLWEFAGSGHVDAAALGLMVLAFVAASRPAPFLAGALLAASALVKFAPALVAPALWRRWDWRAPLAFAVTAVALYVPYLDAGRAVLGFLPGYAQEEGLAAGHGFLLWAIAQKLFGLSPSATWIYAAAAALLLAAAGLSVAFRRNGEQIALVSALSLLVLFTVLLSPHHAWYFTWMVPLLAFRASAAVIYLTCAAPLLYGMIPIPGADTVNAVVYGPFAALLAAELLLSRRTPQQEIVDGRSVEPQPAG